MNIRVFDGKRMVVSSLYDLVYGYIGHGIKETIRDNPQGCSHIQRSIGLNDINGVEIYEDDPVKQNGKIGKIVWVNCGFYIDILHDGNTYTIIDDEKIEVINGNL